MMESENMQDTKVKSVSAKWPQPGPEYFAAMESVSGDWDKAGAS